MGLDGPGRGVPPALAGRARRAYASLAGQLAEAGRLPVWQRLRRLLVQAWLRLLGLGRVVLPALKRRTIAFLDWLQARSWLGAPLKSLSLQIIALNLVGIIVLAILILFLSPYQAALIRDKLENLIAQSEVIAATIASTATQESDRIELGSDLMEPEQLEQLRRLTQAMRSLQLSIRPDRLAPILKLVVQPTGMRVRVYGLDGDLIFDSNILTGDPSRSGSEAGDGKAPPVVLRSIWTRLSDWMDGTDLPVYRDIGHAKATIYPEARLALQGATTPLMLMDERGRRMVTIAVPIHRKDVLGLLLVSTRGGEIDKLVWKERRAILWITGLGAFVMALSSLLLAGTIARPLRQLARAAERVRSNLRNREDLPDFSYRQDEIGYLSGTLRDMTDALYRRVEKSERFAADVAHELKNPLGSVRGAAENLGRVKSDEDRQMFAEMIQGDVKRLTRLIDDISKATRADAEMALSDTGPVDLAGLLTTLVDLANDVHVRDGQKVVLEIAPARPGQVHPYRIDGHETRLGQVFRNLLDNAISFSPPDGTVRVKASREGESILVTVEDEGPGIPPGNLEKIFNRFYTDRPAGSFGNNSGLGLSISQDIVLAHRGEIWAENRIENTVQRTGTSDLGVVNSRVAGARFSVRLPTGAAPHVRGQRPRVRSAGR